MSVQNILQSYYELLDDALDIRMDNEPEVLESLRLTYKVRHNLVHHLIAFMTTRDYSLFNEQRIDQVFSKIRNIPTNIGRLTPDMVIFINKYDEICGHNVGIDMLKHIFIVDISVSRLSNMSSDDKLNKYEKIKEYVEKETSIMPDVIRIHPIALLPDMTNMEKEIYDFLCLINKQDDIDEFPFADVRLYMNSLVGVQSRLKDKINNESLINAFFKQEFGTKDGEEEFIFDDILRTRIPELNKYYFENVDKRNSSASEKLIESFNDINNFSPEQLSQSNEEEFTKWVNMYKELLEDPDIIKTFSEKDTIPESVRSAADEMDNFSRDFSSKKIKPSHHIFTPIDELIATSGFEYIDNPSVFENNEQNQILRMLRLFNYALKGNNSTEKDEAFLNDIHESFEKIISSDTFISQKTVFDKNVWMNERYDKSLHEEYHAYREQCIANRTPVDSLLNFGKRFKSNDSIGRLPLENEVRFYKQKMIKIPHVVMSEQGGLWWEKGHSGKKDPKHVEKLKVEYSCNFDHAQYVDKLMSMLTNKLKRSVNSDSARRGYNINDPKRLKETEHTQFYNFVMASNDLDNNTFNFFKDESRKVIKPILKLLEQTVGYTYLYSQTLFAEQLMHFTQFSLPSNTFSFFTTGCHNILCIVNNSYHDSGKDVGKAFMFIGYFEDPEWENPFFGNMKTFTKKIGERTKTFFITGWRRLETFKLTFLKDQFYSVLSTSVNALLRYKSILVGFSHLYSPDDYLYDIVKHHFSLKIIVAMTSNQRIAEMLADMRYAIMASFSDFSEIEKLVLDKFSPKYNTVMEAWIASRVKNLAMQIENFKDKENIRTFFKQPIFSKGKRRDDSIGGKFELPSIWTGVIITELQDLLDDMFIYVHTLKDPSNIHHENIKAIETILEYQRKYDSLSKKRKQGNIFEMQEIKEFLLSRNPIGHVSKLVKLSSSRTMSTLKGFDLNLRSKSHFFEKVANITSTKAAIPEYEREIIDLPDRSKKRLKQKKKRKEKQASELGIHQESISENLLNENNRLTREKVNFMTDYGKVNNVKVSPQVPRNIITDVAKESFLPGNNRSKVHDCLLDILENNIDLSTVFDVAEWNIKSNNARVVSDICIKAQYGAKREFYVINIGAKCNARILENVFSEICKSLPNEMISVPGDKKMLIMQNFINDALVKKGSDQQVIFVNGDCTKWSAAETMECFMSLITGLSGYLEPEIIKYLLCIVSMWANKNITIPQSILQNTFFTIDGKTEYLNTKRPIIDSDQNFLQGMFNYMSSYKAVCSSNLTRDMWKRMFPESKLNCEHLEHSDDYSLLIVSSDLEEVRKFRTLHRMIMRSHGFNDSVKKTNTQRFLMEFISLVSLNGHMTYPHIKKLKECGMNLGCTGYRDDIDGAMSRVGEAVRVGSVMASAYFMQRSHLYNVCRSYSILPTQRNCFVTKMDDLFRLPVEVFGVPDTHPLLSFLTKGLANNYRLMNYQKNDKDGVSLNVGGLVRPVKINDIFENLFLLTSYSDKEKNVFNSEDFTAGMRLFHPGYLFDIENKLIKKIRAKVSMSIEEATEFWNNHVSYNFIKPQNRKLLVPWMRAMYFKHNFSLAYSRNSRSQITLRLSTFTSKKCLFLFPNDMINMDSSKQVGIRDYMNMFLSSCIDCNQSEEGIEYHHDLNNIIAQERSDTNSDQIWSRLKLISLNCDASISTIYSMMDNSRAIYNKSHGRSTVATLTPVKVNWLTLNNPPDAIIQYIFNNEDFLMDNRKNKGLASLESDKRKLQSIYGDLSDLSNIGIEIVKAVYTDVILSQNKRNLCMTYSSSIQNIEEFVKTHLEFGSVFNVKFSLFTSGATESINPHTGEMYYKRLYTYTKNEYKLLIEDSALVYSLLKHGYKCDDEMVKRTLNNLKVKTKFEADNPVSIVASELWDTQTVNDLQIMGCSNSELKIFGFLKAFLKNDVQDIMDLVNKDFSYSYIYFKPEQWMTSLIRESVEFVYQNSLFNAHHLVNGDIILFTNSRKKYLLADSYLIAQKLFNMVKLHELEKSFGITSLRDVQNDKTFRQKPEDTLKLINLNKKFFLRLFKEYHVDSAFCFDTTSESTRFKYFEHNGIDMNGEEIEESFDKLINIIGTFKFIYSETMLESKGTLKEFINKKINIDFDTMSVFNGKRKLFGLPLLGCEQSNATEVINDVELNGLTLNWWLSENRIKSLIGRSDIAIDNFSYNKMLNFYIKDNRWILHAETIKILNDLKKMPTKMLKSVPEEIFRTIEDRIVGNKNQQAGKMDAYTFLESIRVRDGHSNPTQDLLSDIIKEHSGLVEQKSIGEVKEEDIETKDEFGMDMDFDAEFGELDDLLDDLDDIQFLQRQEDSDNDVDDEIDRILEKDESSNDSSKDSMINFADFQFLNPVFVKEEALVLGRTKTEGVLNSIGDPTSFLIRRMYANNMQIDHLSPKEKIGLLYKIHQILLCAFVLTDIELYLAIVLSDKLIKNLHKSEEWRIADDFVCVINEDNEFDFFLKYVGELGQTQEELIRNTSGKIRYQRINRGLGSLSRGSVRQEIINKVPKDEVEKYYLIPVNERRSISLLDDCSSTFTIQNFLGVEILFSCYERLFKEPFVRTGFVLEILHELEETHSEK